MLDASVHGSGPRGTVPVQVVEGWVKAVRALRVQCDRIRDSALGLFFREACILKLLISADFFLDSDRSPIIRRPNWTDALD